MIERKLTKEEEKTLDELIRKGTPLEEAEKKVLGSTKQKRL